MEKPIWCINLVTLRKKKKISQTELAEILGVARSTVGMWETGVREPDLATFQRLADLYNESLDFIMGRINDQSSPDKLRKPPDLKVADEIFFDGYLEASEEEKEQLRRYWYEQVKKMKEGPPEDEDETPSAWDIVREKK